MDREIKYLGLPNGREYVVNALYAGATVEGITEQSFIRHAGNKYQSHLQEAKAVYTVHLEGGMKIEIWWCPGLEVGYYEGGE